MNVTSEPGTWTTATVTAPDHDTAVRRAVREARRAGHRVRDVASATRQTIAGSGKGHRWVVELRIDTDDRGQDLTPKESAGSTPH